LARRQFKLQELSGSQGSNVRRCFIAPGSAADTDFADALDRIFGNRFRRHIYSSGLGSKGAILRRHNDMAANSKITDNLGVIGCIDDGGCLASKTGEVFRNGKVQNHEIRWQKRLHGDGVCELARANQTSAYIENLPIDRLKEIFRRDQTLNCGKRVVVNEDCADQTLLSLDAVRQSSAENVIDCCGVLLNVHGITPGWRLNQPRVSTQEIGQSDRDGAKSKAAPAWRLS
jgi:hypothetical protein